MRDTLGGDAGEMVRTVKSVRDIPCAIGFGVSTPEQARKMSKLADGVIIGSAIVNRIAEHGRDCVEPVSAFARAVREAIDGTV